MKKLVVLKVRGINNGICKVHIHVPERSAQRISESLEPETSIFDVDQELEHGKIFDGDIVTIPQDIEKTRILIIKSKDGSFKNLPNEKAFRFIFNGETLSATFDPNYYPTSQRIS